MGKTTRRICVNRLPLNTRTGNPIDAAVSCRHRRCVIVLTTTGKILKFQALPDIDPDGEINIEKQGA
jgi:hypothetical protein